MATKKASIEPAGPPWSDAHVKWLSDTGRRLTTQDGRKVQVWDLKVDSKDDATLSAWARHFRNHYCLDRQIDRLRRGTRKSRREYLEDLVFPDRAATPGPSIRSGDFAEVLLADYVEYVQQYWVPRFRYDHKAVRNISTPGTDIVGFRVADKKASSRDRLITCEAKAALTKTKKNRLQQAVDDSTKDYHTRKGEALNAIKQRLLDAGDESSADVVERFQDSEDFPYTEETGAAAVLCSAAYDEATLRSTDCSGHPNSDRLSLLVIRAPQEQLMTFVHALYARAADEA